MVSKVGRVSSYHDNGDWEENPVTVHRSIKKMCTLLFDYSQQLRIPLDRLLHVVRHATNYLPISKIDEKTWISTS